MSEDPHPCPDLGGEAFCPLPRWARLLMTIGPMAGFGLALLVANLVAGHAAWVFIISMTVGGFLGGGKLVILAGAIESAPVGMLPLAGLVVFGDVSTALVIVANMHHLYRIPAVGRRLAVAREAGFRVLRSHKWMRRAAEVGLGLFVAVPFQGTGAVLGVVLGRILGLSRPAILISILVGSSIGSASVVLVGYLGREEIAVIADNPLLGIATVGASLGLTFILGRWFLGQRRPDSDGSAPSEGSPT